MGKHTALDEAVVHPLVADALRRRVLPGAGTHRPGAANVVAALPPSASAALPPSASAALPPSASAVGWPVDPGVGRGLGWPGDPQPDPRPDAGGESRHPADDGSLIAALEEAATSPTPAPEEAPRRSGWRRFFGGGHSSARSGTSAA